jgi:polysaccharide chain length determinant protein (PEP-CTERM system associated)
MIVGIYYAIALPKIFEANTLILVEPQRVPSNYVKSIVSSDIESRISTISQQILSRTNLENIIEQYNLFSNPKNNNPFMEDKLENLRKLIKIDVQRGRAGKSTFSISFRNKNPENAMKVANALAFIFIEENLKVREAYAQGTSVFLEQELSQMRSRLEDVEETLKIYRKKFMGELPEQLETNLAILDRLQRQLTEKQRNLLDIKEMLRSLEKQKSEIQDIQRYDFTASMNTDFTTDSADSVKLAQLEEELENLKARYKDRHPDVVQIRKRIAVLQEKIRAESENIGEEAMESKETQLELPEFEPEDFAKNQKEEIRKDIRKQENEIAKLIAQISKYERRVENTPKREQELLSLNRDYNNIKASYDSLVRRKLEAEIAVNMEKKQKGERFRVIDPAKLPEKPISSNLMVVFMVAMAAGIGFGPGLIYLQDFLNNSLKDPEKFEADLGVAVLATVPKIYNAKDLRLKKLNGVLTVFSLLVAACLFAGFAMIVFNGVEPTLEIVQNLASL